MKLLVDIFVIAACLVGTVVVLTCCVASHRADVQMRQMQEHHEP